MSNRQSIISGDKPLLLLVLLLGLGLLLASCTGVTTVPGGWSGGTITNDTLFTVSMKGDLVAVRVTDGSRLWKAFLKTPGTPAGGFGCAPAGPRAVAVYGSPAVAGDLVYVGGYDGTLYAFNFGREEPKWWYPRQGDSIGSIVGAPIVGQGKVYFSSANGKVYALEATDGYKEWEFATSDKIWSTPAINNDTLFIGSFDKKLYALKTSDGSKKWEFETEGAIASSPTVADNIVYLASFDRNLYAINAGDGSFRWKFRADNWFWARPVVHNGIVYAASLDGKVYILDAKSGDKLAEPLDLGSPVSSTPVVVGSAVIVATEDGVVYAIDTNDNQKRQLVNLEERVDAPLTARQGVVYIHTAKDNLFAVDAQSGAVREFNIK